MFDLLVNIELQARPNGLTAAGLTAKNEREKERQEAFINVYTDFSNDSVKS